MEAVKAEFYRRADECAKYIELLAFIEAGSPGAKLAHGAGEFVVETIHEQVLKASVYLHLYNLVESTINRAFDVLINAICRDGACFHELTDEWRLAWLDFKTTDLDQDDDRNRLMRILAVTSALVDRLPVELRPKLPAGSLDEKKIASLAKRFGFELTIRETVRNNVIQLKPLERVKDNRNKLAHGQRSFSDCGKDPTVPDLKKDYSATRDYLEDVLDSLQRAIAGRSWRRMSATMPLASAAGS